MSMFIIFHPRLSYIACTHFLIVHLFSPSIHPSIHLYLFLSISLCVSFSSTGTCVTELITPRARSALKRTVIRETTNISCKFCEKKASDPPVSWLEVLLICPHTNHSPSRYADILQSSPASPSPVPAFSRRHLAHSSTSWKPMPKVVFFWPIPGAAPPGHG